MKKSTENQSKKVETMTKSNKKSTDKPKAAEGEAERRKEYRKNVGEVFGCLRFVMDAVRGVLAKGEYIRSMHIVEAPAGTGWKTSLNNNRDNSYDLHVFLTEDAFTLYKRGVGADMNKMVITANYTPDFWKKRLAA
jgi:hypothetical protein